MAGRPRKSGLKAPLPAVRSFAPSKHDSNCRCPRCTGFTLGNTYALGHGHPETHGAYTRSLLKIGPLVEERANELRELLPVWHPADEVALRALSLILIRIERAEAAFEQLERELEEAGTGALALYGDDELRLNGRVVRVDRLRADLARWLRSAERYLAALGMTPGSRARLGLDLARAQRYTLFDLHREAAQEAEEVAG